MEGFGDLAGSSVGLRLFLEAFEDLVSGQMPQGYEPSPTFLEVAFPEVSLGDG